MPMRTVPKKHNPFAVGPVRVAFTVGAETSDAITVTGTVYGPGDTPLGYTVLDMYLSGTAAVGDIVGTAPAGGVAIGTYGKILVSLVSNKMWKVRTDSSGRFQLTLTNATTTPTFYLHVQLPDGTTAVSGAITFA